MTGGIERAVARMPIVGPDGLCYNVAKCYMMEDAYSRMFYDTLRT